MIKIYDKGVYLVDGEQIVPDGPNCAGEVTSLTGGAPDHVAAQRATMSYGILAAHNTSGDMQKLKLTFDALTSHDITFVGIIQTAKASGLKEFPMPYVLTNCHNSLCAVGGTINEDDHLFGLSAARKYGGIYVPPHQAVIHMYMREMQAGCGKMILGSDSHTRYGALGTMAIGEGGGELAKQLLGKTYDIAYPGVVGIYLDGEPRPGVGPQDIALAIIGAVYKKNTVKNCVMEFVGAGIKNLSTDYRCTIDVMTTEAACLSTIWVTDDDTKRFLTVHGRGDDYKELKPGPVAYYDNMVYVDMSAIKPMIALPFHPSNTYEIETVNQNLGDILRQVEKDAVDLIGPGVETGLTQKIENGRLKVDQGIIAGCAGGTFTNVMAAHDILKGQGMGDGVFSLSIYPSSQPVMLELTKNGAITDLMQIGAVIRTAFCGPCFGAGDVPAHRGLSIRHTTRNFPNREGSNPTKGQMASVALMDARSIAATARSGGYLTPATDYEVSYTDPAYTFDASPYENRVYNGFDKPDPDAEIIYGPNIADWPEISALGDHLLLRVVSYITDPVTTTDELIPSGETSSYRSNPLGMAEFTLARRDPAYVGRAKAVAAMEAARASGACTGEVNRLFVRIRDIPGCGAVAPEATTIGSTIYAVKPGDGSAREQAASCQRVLGGAANIAVDYATKRYRSNLINWGMIPFQLAGKPNFGNDDYIFVPNVRDAIMGDTASIKAYVLGNTPKALALSIAPLTDEEKHILLTGCLINYYRA